MVIALLAAVALFQFQKGVISVLTGSALAGLLSYLLATLLI
jgi:chromate transporter